MIFGEILINEIMKYPEFYQMDTTEYKEKKNSAVYEKVAAALSLTCEKEITYDAVKDTWEKLVRMYSEYRRKLVCSTTSGSGATRQQHPHQDLMDKLSFLSDKTSNRVGKSSIGVSKSKSKKLNELDNILAQKQAARIIVSEPDRFRRTKKSNTDDVFKNELTAMSSAIKICAEKFAEKIMKSSNETNSAEPYESVIYRYFEKIEDEEIKDAMMTSMLEVITHFPQKPQQ